MEINGSIILTKLKNVVVSKGIIAVNRFDKRMDEYYQCYITRHKYQRLVVKLSSSSQAPIQI